MITKKLSLPDNVHIFSTRTAETIEVPGLPVVIHGRGFPHRAVPENLAIDYPVAVSAKFNLGLLHTSLTGRPGHDTYAPCSEQDLRSKSYQYWALGHVHKPEIISEDPWIVFSGNCQGRHVRETGPRGCCLVSVNNSLEVESVDWSDLDVVRWQVLEVDLNGVEKETEALKSIRASISNGIAASEGRLLAARIILTGATSLHGALHKDARHLRAEVLAIAQDFGEEFIWVERIKTETSPVYDISQLAERDNLTKIVLETLEEVTQDLDVLPDEIDEMLGVLPSEIRIEVESEWDENRRAGVIEEVRAIVLQTLEKRGEDVA